MRNDNREEEALTVVRFALFSQEKGRLICCAIAGKRTNSKLLEPTHSRLVFVRL